MTSNPKPLPGKLNRSAATRRLRTKAGAARSEEGGLESLDHFTPSQMACGHQLTPAGRAGAEFGQIVAPITAFQRLRGSHGHTSQPVSIAKYATWSLMC